jgi:hypothetical protein
MMAIAMRGGFEACDFVDDGVEDELFFFRFISTQYTSTL